MVYTDDFVFFEESEGVVGTVLGASVRGFGKYF